MQNTAYIRLKNLTLTYSLPKQIVERLRIEGMHISFIGQNLWSYSPVYKITRDIDVEQMDRNTGDYYPMLKSYGLAVSLDF